MIAQPTSWPNVEWRHLVRWYNALNLKDEKIRAISCKAEHSKRFEKKFHVKQKQNVKVTRRLIESSGKFLKVLENSIIFDWSKREEETLITGHFPETVTSFY